MYRYRQNTGLIHYRYDKKGLDVLMQTTFTSLTQHVLVPKESYELILEYAQSHEDHRTFIPDVEFTDYNESFSVMNKFIEDALSSISTGRYSDEQISLAAQKFVTESAKLWPTTEVYHNRILKYMEDAYKIPEKAQAARDKLMLEHSAHADAVTYMYTKYLEAYASRVMNDVEYIATYTQGVPVPMVEAFDADFHGYYMSEDLGNQIMAIPGMIIKLIKKLMNSLSYTLTESGKAFANRILANGQVDEAVIKKLYELYVAKNKASAQAPIRYPNPQKVNDLRKAYATGFEAFTSQMVNLVNNGDFKSIDTGVVQMIQKFQVVTQNETLPRGASFQEFRTAVLSIANNILLMDMFMKSLITIDDALAAKYGADPAELKKMISEGKGNSDVDKQFDAGMQRRAEAKATSKVESVTDEMDDMFEDGVRESAAYGKINDILDFFTSAGGLASGIQTSVTRVAALIDGDIMGFLGLGGLGDTIQSAGQIFSRESNIASNNDSILFMEDTPAPAPQQPTPAQAAPDGQSAAAESGETEEKTKATIFERLKGFFNADGEPTDELTKTDKVMAWISKIPKVGPELQKIISETMNWIFESIQGIYENMKNASPKKEPTSAAEGQPVPGKDNGNSPKPAQAKPAATPAANPTGSSPTPGAQPARAVVRPVKKKLESFIDDIDSSYMTEGPGEVVKNIGKGVSMAGTAVNLILTAKGIQASWSTIKNAVSGNEINFKEVAMIVIGILNAKKLISKASKNEQIQDAVEAGKRTVKKTGENIKAASQPQDAIARNFGADENIIGTMRRHAQDKSDWKTVMADKYVQDHIRNIAIVIVCVSVIVVIQRIVFGENAKNALSKAARNFHNGRPAKYVPMAQAVANNRAAVPPLMTQLWTKSDQAIKNLWTYINGWLYGGQTIQGADGKKVKTIGLGRIIKDELTSLSPYVDLKQAIQIDLPDDTTQQR